ncbi:MAG: cell division protein SepF [Lachnospiraceae bacterium]|nr:cell division protein SepF [Lachnospiraceae bacterium]
MGVFDDLLKKMNLGVDDDEPEDDEDSFDLPARGRSDESFYEDDSEEPVKPARPAIKKAEKQKGRVIPMKQAPQGNSVNIRVVKPISQEDITACVDSLLDHESIIINFEGGDIGEAQRAIDFLAGACYAINAHFEKISVYIFLATPEDVELNGEDLEKLDSGLGPLSFNMNVR